MFGKGAQKLGIDPGLPASSTIGANIGAKECLDLISELIKRFPGALRRGSVPSLLKRQEQGSRPAGVLEFAPCFQVKDCGTKCCFSWLATKKIPKTQMTASNVPLG